jgi:hypothetical protein
MFVVCDANGECKGIFANEEFANKLAEYYGAYVSEHTEVSPLWTQNDFDEFIKNNP